MRKFVIHRGSPFHHEICSTTPSLMPFRRGEGVLDLVAPTELVLAEIEVERRHLTPPGISTTAIVTIDALPTLTADASERP